MALRFGGGELTVVIDRNPLTCFKTQTVLSRRQTANVHIQMAVQTWEQYCFE